MSRTALRRLGATLAALLLALGLAGVAGAGGWSVVVLDSESALIGVDRPVDAGAPFTIGFTVLQHGKTPVDGITPKITLTSAAGGSQDEAKPLRLTFFAEPEGGPGHYVAAITLPQAGVWAWEIDAFGPVATMAPITVAAPAPALAPADPTPALALWGAIAALALLAAALLTLRSRRPAAAVR
jgi:hypothetical protein